MLDDIYERQLAADIRFRGQPIATFLRPVFLSQEQHDLVRRASQVLLDCAERLIEQYMVDPEVRKTIGLPPDEEEFALLDTGFERQVVIARPDSFLNGDRLEFFEFNSDSPAGVVWTDLHEEVFLSSTVPSEHPWSKDLGPAAASEGGALWEKCTDVAEGSLWILMEDARKMGGNTIGEIRWVPQWLVFI